jgi:Secretion system C-terminal sorting domain
MKKILLLVVVLLLVFTANKLVTHKTEIKQRISKVQKKDIIPTQKGQKKTPEERALYDEARDLHEYYRQVNPLTGEIPRDQKVLEKQQSIKAKLTVDENNLRILAPEATFVNRGPSNLGGRTRTLVVDRSDNTGNTILAGGVSGGVFRTTNGGTTWAKVSPFDEIHNVTTLVQDPRSGFGSTWYYGTGEGSGNSASLGAFYLGGGIWKSTDSGLTWSQATGTSSTQEAYDSFFDIIFKLDVHPTTGDIFAAVGGQIKRFDLGTSTWVTELANSGGSTAFATDVVITSTGRVYAAFSGNQDAVIEGIWTSANGEGGWTRINDPIFTPAGRVVLALAPSNEDKLYILFDNGTSSSCAGTPAIEADLWRWTQSTTILDDLSSKLPDEPGCSDGNDPFAIQGGYDLVVSVKPDDENFVVIGGTNAYKMPDITAFASFSRIGGYMNSSGYSLYDTAGGAEHHPDIHALVFNPFNTNELFSGTDGGVHKTTDITAGTIDWVNLNNNYQTYQFYHVAIDPMSGSDFVIGGAQDNGTHGGGTDFGQPDLTTQASIFGGDGVAVGISNDDACTPIFIGAQNGTFYRVCSGFTYIEPTGSSSQFVTYFFLDPDNNKTLFYAGKGTLYRTNDATNVTPSTWTNLGSPTGFGGGSEWFQTFSTTRGTYSAVTSYLLMGGDTGSILRLDDPQNATDVTGVVDITPAGASTTFPSNVTGLAIHPTNRDIVLATYSNYGITNIYLTTNATSATPSWTLVERNLSAHSIRSAAITVASGETMYLVGTARGLYSTTDPTSVDWTREAPSLIGFAVVSSMAYRPADNKLLIGTHGNGMFEATITSTLSVNEFDISDNIKIFPNPVVDNLNVKLDLNLGNEPSFIVHNVLGQTISRGKLLNSNLDVSQLQTGLYFLQINVDGKKGVKQFIKK